MRREHISQQNEQEFDQIVANLAEFLPKVAPVDRSTLLKAILHDVLKGRISGSRENQRAVLVGMLQSHNNLRIDAKQLEALTDYLLTINSNTLLRLSLAKNNIQLSPLELTIIQILQEEGSVFHYSLLDMLDAHSDKILFGADIGREVHLAFLYLTTELSGKDLEELTLWLGGTIIAFKGMQHSFQKPTPEQYEFV